MHLIDLVDLGRTMFLSYCVSNLLMSFCCFVSHVSNLRIFQTNCKLRQLNSEAFLHFKIWQFQYQGHVYYKAYIFHSSNSKIYLKHIKPLFLQLEKILIEKSLFKMNKRISKFDILYMVMLLWYSKFKCLLKTSPHSNLKQYDIMYV